MPTLVNTRDNVPLDFTTLTAAFRAKPYDKAAFLASNRRKRSSRRMAAHWRSKGSPAAAKYHTGQAKMHRSDAAYIAKELVKKPRRPRRS